MTLALVSRVGLKQASMTDTLKFGPSVCLAARICDNPNISTQKYIYLYLSLYPFDRGARTGSLCSACERAGDGNMKAADS